MTAKTAIAPLDRMKILLQAHNTHYKNYGVISGMIHVVKHEGYLGLYKGNGAMMIRVFPYAASQFLSFEFYSKTLRPYFHKDSQMFKFFAGSAAGLNAVILTYPLDLARARLAFIVKPKSQNVVPSTSSNVRVNLSPASVNAVRSIGTTTTASSNSVPTGVLSTLIHVAKTEGGILGLYRGLTPTMCHIIPYSGFNFYCFEKLKNLLLKKYGSVFGQVKNDQIVLTVGGKLTCGAVAGSVAQTVAYPFDVCRRRMQLSFLSEETKKYSKGVVKTLVMVYQEHGIVKGLFRGMTANYIRTAPMISINFAVYELMKQTLGLKTGIDIKT